MKFDLTINTDVARQILTGFIKSEVSRVGFTHVVINLSGGLDSALSCALAAEAMGPENVLALCLPYRSSSQYSLEHSQLMLDKFKVQRFQCRVLRNHESVVWRELEVNVMLGKRIRQLKQPASKVVRYSSHK